MFRGGIEDELFVEPSDDSNESVPNAFSTSTKWNDGLGFGSDFRWVVVHFPAAWIWVIILAAWGLIKTEENPLLGATGSLAIGLLTGMDAVR